MNFWGTLKFFSKRVSGPEAMTRNLISFVLNLVNVAIRVGTPLYIAENYEELDGTAAIVLGGGILLGEVIPSLRDYIQSPVGVIAQRRITDEIHDEWFGMDLSRRIQTPIGEMAKLIGSNYGAAQEFVPSVSGALLPFVLQSFAVSIALAITSGELAFFSLGFFALYSGLIIYSARRYNASWEESREIGQEAYQKLLATNGVYRLARQFNNIDHQNEIMHEVVSRSEFAYRRNYQINFLTKIATSIIAIAAPVTGLLYEYYNDNSSGLYLSMLAYVLFDFGRMLQNVTSDLFKIEAAMVDTQKIIDFLAVESTVKDSQNAKPCILKQPPLIEFQDVGFSYATTENENGHHDGVKQALRGIRMTIWPGQTVGIVGPSGAGKTTIGHLLQRFYTASSGAILINSMDIRDVTEHSLRHNMVVAGQNLDVVPGTIKDNIQYGNLKAEKKEIIYAAICAGLISTEQGPDEVDEVLNKRVGENGDALSGGEKQRMTLARALLKGGVMLLLDEPTSGLDPETKKSVQTTIDRILESNQATAIIITHDLYTLTHADRIFYLEDGLIQEQGTFDELVTLQGRFYQQLQVQLREERIDIEAWRGSKPESKEADAEQSRVLFNRNWQPYDQRYPLRGHGKQYTVFSQITGTDRGLRQPLLDDPDDSAEHLDYGLS